MLFQRRDGDSDGHSDPASASLRHQKRHGNWCCVVLKGLPRCGNHAFKVPDRFLYIVYPAPEDAATVNSIQAKGQECES